MIDIPAGVGALGTNAALLNLGPDFGRNPTRAILNFQVCPSRPTASVRKTWLLPD